jgi:hypothetical protein
MISASIRRLFTKRSLMTVLVMALVLRGMIPVGFMADASAPKNTLLPITICTGFGPKTVFLDQQGVSHTSDQPAHHQQTGEAHAKAPCAFATGNIFTVADAATALATPEFFTPNISWPPENLFITAHYSGNAAPRAPPSAA